MTAGVSLKNECKKHPEMGRDFDHRRLCADEVRSWRLIGTWIAN